MKNITIKLFILIVTFLSFKLSYADVPPPPMPDYMKKHNFTPPPSAAPQAKLQNSQMDIQKNKVTKEGKFLEKPSQTKKIFSKTIKETPTPTPEADSVKNDLADPDPESIEIVDIEPKQSALEQVDDVGIAEQEFENAQMGDQELQTTKEDFLQETEPDLAETNSDGQKDLASVEKQLEDANSRELSSVKTFKSGMHKFLKKCTMYSEPSSLSQHRGSINAGRKLWIDSHSNDWRKVYKKSGAVYIPADCL